MPDGAEVDVCDADPGHPVAVAVRAGLRDLVRLWRGDLEWPAAVRSGLIEVDGPSELARAVPSWFTLPPFAAVPRPEPVH